LNPLKTPPCYEIPSEILYSDIIEQVNTHNDPLPTPPLSLTTPSTINVNPKLIESELKERSEASFQTINELVKTLHMKVQKKIIKETQLKLLKKKLTIK
jgi:hypothetical protein